MDRIWTSYFVEQRSMVAKVNEFNRTIVLDYNSRTTVLLSATRHLFFRFVHLYLSSCKQPKCSVGGPEIVTMFT